jgi:hypothetical protein
MKSKIKYGNSFDFKTIIAKIRNNVLKYFYTLKQQYNKYSLFFVLKVKSFKKQEIFHHSDKRLYVKDIENIFDGGLPIEAVEFLLLPPEGRTIEETKNILMEISSGKYLPPKKEEIKMVAETIEVAPGIVKPRRKRKILVDN